MAEPLTHGDIANLIARHDAEAVRDILHATQSNMGGHVAVASALAAATASLGFIRDAIGDGAAEAAADMVRAAVARRQDRVKPVREAC